MLDHYASLTNGDLVPIDVLDQAEYIRQVAFAQLDQGRRTQLGQYSTPLSTARLMASMFEFREPALRLLDPGAGSGVLTAAVIVEALARSIPPTSVEVVAYEVDQRLVRHLDATLQLCQWFCEQRGVSFEADIREEDFVSHALPIVAGDLFAPPLIPFTCSVLNPPYNKIGATSTIGKRLRRAGIEVTNSYAAFVALATAMLGPKGELVSITPRSFCNGPYFRAFRRLFLHKMRLRRIHVFDARDQVFRDDTVLQETVIVSAVRDQEHQSVCISSSTSADDDYETRRDVAYREVVAPSDPDFVIHIVTDEVGSRFSQEVQKLTTTLDDLGLMVSTGKVVDFRARHLLTLSQGDNTVPLLYPQNLSKGAITWPVGSSKKPQYIVNSPESRPLLVPSSCYVLVKRFSAKEEARRVVAALYDATHFDAPYVGVENHLNYYHSNGAGLDTVLAKGLTVYLNSTFVDEYFRQFSGHTQVNAADLRRLQYPSREQLESLGYLITDRFPSQAEVDQHVQEVLRAMDQHLSQLDPLAVKQRLAEAQRALKELGFPPQQQNERSALTLLALLDLSPSTAWDQATNPMLGITPMMEFFATHYGRRYAPNTRETVRRQTIHQFLAAGLVMQNPDDPLRPINSGKNVYQIEEEALEVLRSFETPKWEQKLRAYLSSLEVVRRRYAAGREMTRIPLRISEQDISLSPGGQNVLVEAIVNEFCPRFTPNGILVYVGDTDAKWAFFKPDVLKRLGVTVDSHGKMPDVVVHFEKMNWLVLIEAVTSHGPVDPKRRAELQEIFQQSSAGLVFVTAFLDRRTMARYLKDISWETEVWVADAPDHLIHFNGERFLGPY